VLKDVFYTATAAGCSGSASQLSLAVGFVDRTNLPLFIKVLDFQFVQVIRRHLDNCQINASWSSIRRTLNNQCRVTASFPRADGGALHIRKATRTEPEQLAIYQALKVNPAPGGISKTMR
jgi:hypothetical protein